MPYYPRQNFSERFKKTYTKLPEALQRQVDKAVSSLTENPFHPGLNAHSIKDAKFYWEAYVNRGWRLVYRGDAGVLHLVDVVAHDEIDRYDTTRLVK